MEYKDTLASYLSEKGHLWLLSRVGAIVTEFENQVYELSKVMPPQFFEISILQVGMADCAPRPISAHLKTLVREIPVPIIQRALVKVIHSCRPLIQRLKYYQRVRPKQFQMSYARLLLSLRNLSNRVVVILIPPVTDELNRHSPGFHLEVARYNSIIKQIARNQDCAVIDATEIFRGDEKFITQDAHITREGHSKIISLIKELYADI